MRSAIKFLLLFCALSVTCVPAISQHKHEEFNTFSETSIAAIKAHMSTDPRSVLKLTQDSRDSIQNLHNKNNQVRANALYDWLTAEAKLRLGILKDALPLSERAVNTLYKVAPKSDDLGNALLTQGGIRAAEGDVSGALNDYQRAYQVFRLIGDPRGKSASLMVIGILYSDGKDNQKSLKYYRMAEEYASASNNIRLALYNNIATTLQDMSNYPKANDYYILARSLADNESNKLLFCRISVNISDNLLQQRKWSASQQNLAPCLTDVAQGRFPSLASQTWAVAAEASFQAGDRQAAQQQIARAFAGVNPAKTTIAFHQAHNAAYQIYKADGQPAKALVHLAALKRLDDEATQLATNTSTALMAARFDFANQELKISQLKADELRRSVSYEHAKARTQRFILLGTLGSFAVIITLLLIGLVTIRRSRDKVNAANDDLAATNSALGKALAAKTEFLATTSHEVRTPLNGILGMTQVMLAEPGVEPLIRDRLDVIHGAGMTMRALVDDILDAAKIEAGNLSIETMPFDLRATLAGAAQLWTEQAHDRSISFDVDLDDCPHGTIGDPARVRQIIFNLLSNAVKFTERGRVSLRAVRDGDAAIRVEVADTGIGIASGKLDEIFESFRQGDASTTRRFGGTGLGLTISRNLARAMNGDVSVSSVEGQGSTFTLTLPHIDAELTSPCTAQADAADLLILERNPIMRSMWRTLFAPETSAIAYAGDSAEAVPCIRAGGIQRVLIDHQTIAAAADVPGALGAICSAASEASATTYLLWPDCPEAERQELIAGGVDAVILKPVSGATILRRLFPLPPEQTTVRVLETQVA